ncbi:MAG: sulfurtransferase complex subunit TusD [Pseudomonadales bacterium]|jgi:tRNA 2-thiouridine synthesizing protein D
MKFSIVIQGAPYSSQAPLTAIYFARALLEQGHEIVRVFFYQDGVHCGNTAIAPPQDEPDIRKMWSEFAGENDVELIVCIASALRRGVLDNAEADRYEKSSASLDSAFTISGLGQLIDAGLNSDRLVTFGA